MPRKKRTRYLYPLTGSSLLTLNKNKTERRKSALCFTSMRALTTNS